MQQYIFYKRRRKYFVWIEFLLLAIFAGACAKKYFHCPEWGYYTIGFIVLIGLPVLFFINKIFRYVFSILLSLLWAAIPILGIIGEGDGKKIAFGIIAGLLLGAISLALHWDFFDFMSNAEVVEYDEY